MTIDRIKELRAQADLAMAEGERLDAEIAAGLADGLADLTLADMRQRRRHLLEQCDDVAEAIALIERRANDPSIKEREKALKRARADARRQADLLVIAADEVDACLAKLDQAFVRMQGRTKDMHAALGAAGITDASRIGVHLLPSLRWAAWCKAPSYAEASQVPRAPADRRRPLRDSIKRLIPAIPE